MSSSLGRVCVVGAGVSGLTAMKECVDAGLTPVCFERQDDLGGVWVYDEKLRDSQGSAIYKSLITNSSKEFTCFSDFPFDPSDPPYLPHDELLRYYRRFADHHRLRNFIHFRQRVVKVEQMQIQQSPVEQQSEDSSATAAKEETSKAWRVVTRKRKEVKREDEDEEEEEEEEEHYFDFVMLCSGVYSKPYTPDYPGLSSFTGRVLHSNEFRDGADFADCGVVLVVGASNSAGDVAVEISHHAHVLLSMRNGTWVVQRQGTSSTPVDMFVQSRFLQCFIPEFIRSRVAAFIANNKLGHKKLGMESNKSFFRGNVMINDEIGLRLLTGRVKAKTKIRRFTETGVEFEDGSKTEKVDAVVFATGYIPYWSYMDKTIVQEGVKNLQLYDHVFPPSLGSKPTLAVIGGVSCLGAHGPVFELQSRWATRIFTGKCSLPDPDVMIRHIRRELAEMWERFGKPKIHFPSVPYMEKLAAKVGCKPSIWKLALSDPLLAIRVAFGPCIPPSYRLTGPHPWKGAREAVLSTQKNTESATMTRTVDVRIHNNVHKETNEQSSFESNFDSPYGLESVIPKQLLNLNLLTHLRNLSVFGSLLCVACVKYFEWF